VPILVKEALEKAEVELLAKSIDRYAEHLNAKLSRITSLQYSSVPAKSIHNSLTTSTLKY